MPKPADQRVRRNRDEGTSSTSVVLKPDPAVDWVEQWSGRKVEVGGTDGQPVLIPAPKGRWLKQTKQQWATFWTAAEAQMVRPHHLPSVERLFQLYDDEERLRRRVARRTPVARMVPLGLDGSARDGEQVVEHDCRAEAVPGHLGVGSQGQLVESADWKALVKTRQEIRQLEDRFAGTPMAEFRVGWQQAAMANEQARAREARELGSVAAELRQSHEGS
jgi:hypothetical protein